MIVRDAVGCSDPGCVRQNNEDCFVLRKDLGLAVVADGMGGAQAGETASKLAVETISEVIAGSQEHSLESLIEAFLQANARVMQRAGEDRSLEGMGTTLVAALTSRPGEVLVASVGDSRAYLLHGELLTLITEDQTWVNEVGRKLGMDEAALRAHPMRHVLTMAVGVSMPLQVRGYRVHPAPGSLLLLSSDGLHGVVGEERIAALLSRPEPLEQRARALIAAARDAGGPDNITCILIAY